MTTKITSGVMGPSAFRKNAIINGDFNIWQRGTSNSSIAHDAFVADRWKYQKFTTGAVHTVHQSSAVPTVAEAGRLFNYSMNVDCTTADAAVAAGDAVAMQQRIEGYNWLPLAQKTFTLSFWVRATKTGTYCVGFRNSAVDRSYVAEYTVSAVDTWEKKTITVTASPSAGTWDYTNGIGLIVDFTLMAGSTYQTTAGSWQTGNFFATANQVNACDSTSNDFRLCGVQLEAGSSATDFEYRTFQDELVLCQRYYEKSFPLATAPAAGLGGASHRVVNHYLAGATVFRENVEFATRKRANPTVTIYNPNDGGAGANQIRNTSAGANTSATDASNSRENSYHVSATGNAGGAAGDAHGWDWVASAEL